jgi:CheY-like chemotaxis protein/two-component sensor histidine kinase
MLAHELRNPLAPIRNAVQVLQMKSPPVPEITRMLQVIDRQMNQMSRLVDDLLDVSRIRGNKITLRKTLLSLTEVVNTALETSRPVLAGSGQAFSVAMPSLPIYIEADATRLAQVISNLLHNAAKYTDRSGRIWLTVEQEGDHAIVSVRDTGVGISAEMLPRIFEMFTQVEHSIDRAHGGLGVGLAVARKLVELHGGTIGVSSDGPGKGSMFTLRIPVSAAMPQAAADNALAQLSATPVATSALCILLADDNRDAAESLAALLRMVGHDVRIAYDGVEAVGLAAEYHPDVAVLDIGMPKMNGYEVAKNLRTDPGTRAMTIIALSGWGQEEDKRHSREAGIDHHLVKPLEPASLLRLLETTTRTRPAAA